MLQSRETIPFLVVNHVCPQSSVCTDTSLKGRLASSFPLEFTKSISGLKTSSIKQRKGPCISLDGPFHALLRSVFVRGALCLLDTTFFLAASTFTQCITSIGQGFSLWLEVLFLVLIGRIVFDDHRLFVA